MFSVERQGNLGNGGRNCFARALEFQSSFWLTAPKLYLRIKRLRLIAVIAVWRTIFPSRYNCECVDRGTVMMEDVAYYLEPVNTEDSSLTSTHYVIVVDSLRAPNTSCGIHCTLFMIE